MSDEKRIRMPADIVTRLPGPQLVPVYGESIVQLLSRAAWLQRRHNDKTDQWQREGKLAPECGALTREACQLVAMLPRLQAAGITPEQIDELARKLPPAIPASQLALDDVQDIAPGDMPLIREVIRGSA